MTVIISIMLFIIFIILSAIHFYWGFGGRWGTTAVFPTRQDNITPTIMPGKIPTFMVAFTLLGTGIFYLVKFGLFKIYLPNWIDKYGLWIITGIFIARAIGDFNYVGFFKKIKQTPFGLKDTKYYTPLCLCIGIFTLLLIFIG